MPSKAPYEVAAARIWPDFTARPARAACAEPDVDPEVFYPRPGGSAAVALARAICARCALRQACLDWALDTGQTFGIWGGHTPEERSKLTRHHHLAARLLPPPQE